MSLHSAFQKGRGSQEWRTECAKQLREMADLLERDQIRLDEVHMEWQFDGRQKVSLEFSGSPEGFAPVMAVIHQGLLA